MRATIYLHIGVPKTGTTSIQRVLAENRDRLLSHGVNFFPGRENQGWLFSSLLAGEPHKAAANVRRHIDTPQKAARVNEDFDRQLTDWLEQNQSPKILISAEALSRLTEEQIDRLKQKLAPYAAGYRVIVYVRDPYDYMNSASLQGLKGGIVRTPGMRISLPEYRRHLGPHIRAFGRENIDMRVFNSGSFLDGDLISDFMAALELPPDFAVSCEAVRLNESLSHEAAIILTETNRAFPGRVNGLANRERVSNFHGYLTRIKGQKFFTDPQEYLRYEKRVRADIDWLNKRLETPSFAFKPPPLPSSPQWNEETVESIRHLVQDMTAEFEDLHRYAPKTVLPARPPALDWLRSSADGEAQGAPPPAFDQQMIRLLGCYLHELAGAIKELKAARAADRGRALVWKSPTKARAHFTEVVRHNPANALAQFRLSQAHFLCGDFAGGRSAAKSASELAPKRWLYKRWFKLLNLLSRKRAPASP